MSFKFQNQLPILQALAYELSGETRKAVDLYLQLWQSYPDSPYAIMAHAKLEPGS